MHRALADARATVDVLHGLLERVGPLGVQSLDELRTFTAQVSEAQRRKRHLAEHLPNAPGVYVFRDAAGRPLYVGKSKDIRTRVRHYFVASETALPDGRDGRAGRPGRRRSSARTPWRPRSASCG